jgi:hypothetical protein
VGLADALAWLSAHDGPTLELVGRLPGGEVGATELRDAGGRRLVAKVLPASWAETVAGLPERTRRLRDRGYPVGRHEVLHVGPFGLLVLQEHAAGLVSDTVSDALLGRLLELNALQAGLGEVVGEGWGANLRRTLTEGADGFCLHAPLRDHSAATRALLARVEAIGQRLDPARVPDDDVVHTDFHHRNVLQVDGDVGAVIDWEGSRGGDRTFDLVTLAFGLVDAQTEPGAADRVWTVVRSVRPPTVVEAYVAHMVLRQVDWSIRHHDAATVERWLRRSERLLAAVG